MPTVLESFIHELGEELDEAAHSELVELDGVHALSILHRLHARTDRIRNPSAFVAQAVKNAFARNAPPGPGDIECVLHRLHQHEIIDAETLKAWHGQGARATYMHLAGLLGQDVGTIRRPPAHPVYKVDARARTLPRQGLERSVANDLLTKWRPKLDQAAIDSLISLGPQITMDILQSLEAKFAKNEVLRNPSAYVQRACENAITPRPGSGLMKSILEPYTRILDSDALNALEKLWPSQALLILQNLSKCTPAPQNKSAYVVRAVAALQQSAAAGLNSPWGMREWAQMPPAPCPVCGAARPVANRGRPCRNCGARLTERMPNDIVDNTSSCNDRTMESLYYEGDELYPEGYYDAEWNFCGGDEEEEEEEEWAEWMEAVEAEEVEEADEAVEAEDVEAGEEGDGEAGEWDEDGLPSSTINGAAFAADDVGVEDVIAEEETLAGRILKRVRNSAAIAADGGGAADTFAEEETLAGRILKRARMS